MQTCVQKASGILSILPNVVIIWEKLTHFGKKDNYQMSQFDYSELADRTRENEIISVKRGNKRSKRFGIAGLTITCVSFAANVALMFVEELV